MTLLSCFACLLVWVCGLSVSSQASADRILILGDSLSAAYNIPYESGWVQLLEKDLSGQHYIVNASVSGETTGGGLARLPALLAEHRPHWVVIQLGGNDGLQGFPLNLIRNNLAKMGELTSSSMATPVYFGIRIPANYGARYTRSFENVFPAVASEQNAPYLNLFQDEFLEISDLMQTDGIHPTEQAQPLIKDHVAAFLIPILSSATAK